MLGIHSQVRKVCAVAEVSQRAGNPDKLAAHPCRDDQPGVGEHAGDGSCVCHRPPFCERRSPQDIDELVG
jgi:hypothetical protein